ncbi:mechanosensitive ion channel family protein [Flavihumibacter solisilvae]|uniref:Mechanosensitive ion channel protein n=1 Tax=Flavihumibacter solisilvae TaxID=1349421 RepID=A0A0C1KZK5_9BACT|nr:mechanosensitive ion channel domain-containing protein [Flavihumibacter solisilvae]KIC92721.1 hypothetical protein OI18_21225 [Flavihumibacter solisilvae]
MATRFILLFIVLFLCRQLNGQQTPGNDSLLPRDSVPPGDSVGRQLVTGERLSSDSVSSQVVVKLEQLTSALNKVNGFLKRGLDTAEIHHELPRIRNLLDNIKTGLYSSEVPPNLRSLNASKTILTQAAAQLDGWQADLEKYQSVLRDLKNEISNIVNDSVFKKLAGDTALFNFYLSQLTDQGKKWTVLREQFRDQVNNISFLLHNVGVTSIEATDLIDEVNYRMSMLKRKMLTKTEPFIWEVTSAGQDGLLRSIARSVLPNWRLVRYYLKDHWSGPLFMLSLTGLFALWVRANLSKVRKIAASQFAHPLKYLGRSYILSSLMLFFTITPFFSSSPPAVYIEILWVVMILVASRLAWPDWSVNYHRYWRTVVLVFLLVGYDNLLISTSVGERYGMLALNIAAMVAGWRLFREVKREPLRYPVFQDEVLWLFVGANVIAMMLNVFGRFTLSKLISNAAVIGIGQALAFYLLVEIIIEAFYLHYEGNRHSRTAAFFLQPRVKEKFRNLLVVLGVIFWLMAFLWSLNMIDTTTELLSDFLSTSRNIGSMDFTLGSIFIFMLVFYISIVISNLLNFFFGGSEQHFGAARKSKVGSWILVIRLFVISVGFLLAMGAAGIPLDKLAIILGALGVGIGFGLQNIVNNLVSGIILAFEKPMDVGDVIEIGTNSGRVKEVGIRSSKISTFDGAEIIVPNGDFISQRLINWTHSNSYRRIDLTIGVAYGTDLDIAQQTIQQVLDGEKDIVAQPAPAILWNEMGNNAVMVKVYFWTSDFDSWVNLKSKMIKAIYNRFGEKGINIPFPQQDLHIRSVDIDVLRRWREFDGTEEENENAK